MKIGREHTCHERVERVFSFLSSLHNTQPRDGLCFVCNKYSLMATHTHIMHIMIKEPPKVLEQSVACFFIVDTGTLFLHPLANVIYIL